jgi:hypothetical protein
MKDDFPTWLLKQRVPMGWLLTTVVGMVGFLAAAVALGSNLASYSSRLQAQEKAIIEIDNTQVDLRQKLEKIDQRLSRIEGQLEFIRTKLSAN